MVEDWLDDERQETRRNFLRMSGGVTGAAVVGGLAGCSGDDGGDGGGDDGGDDGGDGSTDDSSGDGSDGSGDDGGDGSESPEYADELFYWGIGTTSPENWEPFTERTGTTVDYTAAQWRPGQVVTQMVQGGANQDYDVAGNDVTLTRVLDGEGVIEPSGLEDLPNWDNVYDELKEDEWTTVDGSPHTLSSVQNGDSVAYLPEQVGDPSGVDSYGILFDEEFQGRTALESGWATAYHKVANYLDHNNMADLDSVRQPSESDVDAVVEFLLNEKDEGQFRTFWSGWQSAVNLLAQEEVYAMDTWEPVVFALEDEGMDAQYLWPNEGFSLWAIGPWMTSSGAENKQETVQEFVNWMMDGWYGAQITTIRGYLTASDLAISYAEDSEDFDASFIEDRHTTVREKFRMDESVHGNRFPDSFEYLTEQWNRLTG